MFWHFLAQSSWIRCNFCTVCTLYPYFWRCKKSPMQRWLEWTCLLITWISGFVDSSCRNADRLWIRKDLSQSSRRRYVGFCRFWSSYHTRTIMYVIFTYIWLTFMVNVGTYTILGWYGICVSDKIWYDQSSIERVVGLPSLQDWYCRGPT